MLAISQLSDDNKYKDVLDTFLSSITKDEYSTQILSKVALMFAAGQSINIAVQLYEKLIELSPNDKDGLKKLAECYDSCDDIEKSKQIYKKLIKLDPNNDEYLSKYIQVCIESKNDLEKAKTENEALKKRNPYEYYNNLFQIYIAEKQYDLAKETLDAGTAAGFGNKLSFDWGRYYFIKEQYDDAIPQFEIAKKEKLFPNNLLDMNIAITLHCKGDSVSALNKMLDIISDGHLPYFYSYETAMVTMLYCYSQDLANIDNRSDYSKFNELKEKYLSIIDKFENNFDSIATLNTKDTLNTKYAIRDTRDIFTANTNPSYFIKSNSHSAPKSQELTFDNLPTVFENWSKQPFIHHFFTPTELKRLRIDIETAVKNSSDPDFSYAGCLINLHHCVEKYTEPLFSAYLDDRIRTLEAKANRAEQRKDALQAELREKVNQKIDLRAQGKPIPRQLYAEIEELRNETFIRTEKFERIEKRLKEFVALSSKKFRLSDLYYLVMVFSTPKTNFNEKDTDSDKDIETDIETDINEDKTSDKEKPKAVKIINPSFGQFLQMHYKQNEDTSNPQLMGAALLYNLERYRIIRNKTTHFNSYDAPYEEFTIRDTVGRHRTNWDHLEGEHTVTKDDFLTSLNLALFSRYSVLNLLSDSFVFYETYSDKTGDFFDKNNDSARTPL